MLGQICVSLRAIITELQLDLVYITLELHKKKYFLSKNKKLTKHAKKKANGGVAAK